MSSLGSYGRRLCGIDVFEYTSLNVRLMFFRGLLIVVQLRSIKQIQ